MKRIITIGLVLASSLLTATASLAADASFDFRQHPIRPATSILKATASFKMLPHKAHRSDDSMPGLTLNKKSINLKHNDTTILNIGKNNSDVYIAIDSTLYYNNNYRDYGEMNCCPHVTGSLWLMNVKPNDTVKCYTSTDTLYCSSDNKTISWPLITYAQPCPFNIMEIINEYPKQ